MPLNFHNATSGEVWLAAVYYDSNCGPTDKWRKEGWWGIQPGTTFTLFSGDNRSMNEYLAYHVDNGNESQSWTNDPNRWYYISEYNAFNQCYDDNTNCNIYDDFAQLDLNGRYGLTVALLDKFAVNLTYFDPPLPPPHDDNWSGGDDGS